MRGSSDALLGGQETSRQPLWRRILRRLRPSIPCRKVKRPDVHEAASGSAHSLSELRQTTGQGSQGAPLPRPRPSSNDAPTISASAAPAPGPSSTSAPGPSAAAGGIDPAPSSAAGPTSNCFCDTIPPPPEGRRNLVVCIDGTANQFGIKVGGLTTLDSLLL